MATTVVVVSDLSGESGARTRVITVGDRAYEVDLTDAEFAEYEALVARYVAVGRRVSRAGGEAPVVGGATLTGTARRSRTEVAAIKAWAEANGWAVPKRGRLGAGLVEAYHQATFRAG